MSEEILGIGSRVKHPAFGDGVIIYIDVAAYKVCFTQFGIKHVGKDYQGWEIIEAIEFDDEVSYTQAEKALVKILKNYDAIQKPIELGDKWHDGLLILKPGDESLKSKEIPIDTFFS